MEPSGFPPDQPQYYQGAKGGWHARHQAPLPASSTATVVSTASNRAAAVQTRSRPGLLIESISKANAKPCSVYNRRGQCAASGLV